MSKNHYDLIIEILKKHGVIAIVLLFLMLVRYDDLKYQRKMDSEMLKNMIEINTNTLNIKHKVEFVDYKISRLENEFDDIKKYQVPSSTLVLANNNEDDEIKYVNIQKEGRN
jgi:surfactin synthase thioesterase subunit